VSSKYEFIDGEKVHYPVVLMCRWAQVSRSGFYEWSQRPTSATAGRRFWLAVQVHKAFTASNGTYGYRRVHVALGRRGIEIGPELVRRLMADLDLVSCQPRPWRITTIAGADPGPVDLLGRDFTATVPGVRFVGDITYVATWEGWVYLATVIDLCTREVVGWAIADHLRTSLVCDALSMAGRHRPIVTGAVFHSDRGCQYTSAELAAHLESLGMVGSMGRTGVCWDNALAESFFASLKKELVHRTVFSTRKKARDAIADYIEVFHNRQRLHSGIGYRTPAEVFEAHQTSEAA
jgi:transposase InsO family protein